jgi:hypothetical protein
VKYAGFEVQLREETFAGADAKKIQSLFNFGEAEKAFIAPYMDVVPGLLAQFSSVLEGVATEFAAQTLMDGAGLIAPLVAVVQSSGVGKTRLVYEHAKRNFSFFCCMREKSKLIIRPALDY